MYNVCTHYFYTIIVVTILLKMAQVSIPVLAIRKEWLKLKLQVIQQVYDCLLLQAKLRLCGVKWTIHGLQLCWGHIYLCYLEPVVVHFVHYLECVTMYVAPYLMGYNSWSKETTGSYFCLP